MKTTNKFLFVLFMLSLAGCITITGKEILSFRDISHIRELNGVYSNLGVTNSEHDGNTYYLSEIIWREKAGLDHSTISTIEVTTAGDDTINVKAKSQDRVVREATFILGKDIQIESGQIILKTSGGFVANEGGIGIYADQVLLGLDEHGQGKYSSESAAAFMALYLVPMALHGRYGASFFRVEK